MTETIPHSYLFVTCIIALQTTSVMGFQDMKEKDTLEEALRAAWDVWTRGVQLDLVTTSTAPSKRKQRARFSLSEDTDAEEDYMQMEQERHMAGDDIEDDTAQETLLLTPFDIQTTGKNLCVHINRTKSHMHIVHCHR